MADVLDMVRARAAARARAVRVSDGVTADRSLIETDYMAWLRAIFPEQMSGYRELAPFHHELLTHAWAIRRERQTAEQSITQRRGEVRNLVDLHADVGLSPAENGK